VADAEAEAGSEGRHPADGVRPVSTEAGRARLSTAPSQARQSRPGFEHRQMRATSAPNGPIHIQMYFCRPTTPPRLCPSGVNSDTILPPYSATTLEASAALPEESPFDNYFHISTETPSRPWGWRRLWMTLQWRWSASSRLTAVSFATRGELRRNSST
jgi:hypothetical protein